MDGRLFTFAGGAVGTWKVTGIIPVTGDPLPAAERIDVVPGAALLPAASWSLRGITSNERYVTRQEKTDLAARQEGLGRPASTRAALIPIRKTPAWWALTQDERREILEEKSRHIQVGLRYLPAIARKLHHCRDLGEPQPFDFLTWFEFSPGDTAAFDELLAALRSSLEWSYVEREVDIRLSRDS